MKLRIMMAFAAILSVTVNAGSQTSTHANIAPEKIIKFAKEVERSAAKLGARAFIISRLGRPEKELPKGIHFTHTAIAIYSNIELANGEFAKGYAIHNLYQVNGRPNKSQLVLDYPVDFFWGVQQLKAGIIIPNQEVQSRLINLVVTGEHQVLHNPNYSVIANPMNNQTQNCTEYTLNLINAAIYQTTDIEQLKANTRAHFTPQRINASRFKLAFGSMLMDEMTTKDHSRKVATATFGSINKYLQQYGLINHSFTLYENGQTEIL